MELGDVIANGIGVSCDHVARGVREEGKNGFKGKKPQVSFPWASG
jgi:hypothetical protein